MGALIKLIAKKLVSLWDELNGFTKWSIEQLAGSAIVEAISRGYTATVNFLSGLSSWVIEKIAALLGL